MCGTQLACCCSNGMAGWMAFLEMGLLVMCGHPFIRSSFFFSFLFTVCMSCLHWTECSPLLLLWCWWLMVYSLHCRSWPQLTRGMAPPKEQMNECTESLRCRIHAVCGHSRNCSDVHIWATICHRDRDHRNFISIRTKHSPINELPSFATHQNNAYN